MRVLLTGSTGMVGRNILEHSRLKEVDVLIPRHSDLNLLDKAQVEKYFTHHHIDLVIHAAGIVGGIMANNQRACKVLGGQHGYGPQSYHVCI